MRWIPADEGLPPRDGSVFLSLCEGSIGLTQYDLADECFYLSKFPAMENGVVRVSKDREHKFTHWMELERPVD
jgi:hypothetical protein